jgi:glyoxylase-like metal-dependent hydrolase (beta-lactamase superfamily II)
MRKHKIKANLFCVILIFVLSLTPTILESQEESTLTLEKVSGDVYCLSGGGGNIGILKSGDALLVVDASYARTANDIMAEIQKLSPLSIRYLINTHYHGDHTGGNAIIGKGAEIISHTNCKASQVAGMKPEEREEGVGVPQKTFEKEMTLKLGEETIHLIHFGPAHTSGDTVLVFDKAKVVHTGDLFFHGVPPYIDVKDGSNTENWVTTIGKLAETYPDFKVIPGHGPVTTMQEYVKFAEYLRYLRKEVAAAIQAGKTKEQAMESIDLSAFDHIKDRGEFLTKKKNIEWIYMELTRK